MSVFKQISASETAEWKRRMAPVPERVPLAEVAEWWLDMWQWRTDILKAEEAGGGNFNPYDGHPSTRAPWSLVVTKYPWIDVTNDRLVLAPLIKAGMKKRSKNNHEMKVWYKSLLEEERHFNTATRGWNSNRSA